MESTEAERDYVRSSVRFVIGVDEAGRGCMAGPVGVAAALYRISPTAVSYRVADSKALTEAAREAALDGMCAEMGVGSREAFLTQLTTSGACCVAHYQRMKPLQAVTARLVDVSVINERNILNATLEGMSAVCNDLVVAYNRTAPHPITPQNCAILIDGNCTPWTFLPEERRREITQLSTRKADVRKKIGHVYPALEGFSCTTIIKGDGTLLSIAAASVVAKVARDTYAVRVMHPAYPRYGFDHHKGYCTKEHRDCVAQLGPCPSHRLDYAPVKQAMST